MFGYIVINKPEMKFKDFDIYQSYYCGLCRTMHDNYTVLKGRVALNYDMTFYSYCYYLVYMNHTRQIKRSSMLFTSTEKASGSAKCICRICS